MKIVVIFTFVAIALVSSTSITRLTISVSNFDENEQTFKTSDEDHKIPTDQHEVKASRPLSYLIKREIFDNFLNEYSITLEPTDTYSSRQAVFIKNYRQIIEHNQRYEQGLETFRMAVNQFSHLSVDELSSYSGDGDNESHRYDNSTVTFSDQDDDDDDDAELPASFNWVDRNVLQPVQSQGRCGSCYVFASIAAIEAQMMMHFRSREKLSEQEAMECLK
jgi:C1A family cysteine protease